MAMTAGASRKKKREKNIGCLQTVSVKVLVRKTDDNHGQSRKEKKDEK